MANGHGGARIGAGQKKKALSDKLVEGNPGKRKLTVMEFTDTADLQGETMPPPRDYLAARQKNGKELLAVEVYERTWTWLHERGCAHLIPAQILEQYAMAISRWIQCEECITEYGFLAKHPTTGNAIPSPYVSMSQSFSKQANNLWFQIYQVVRENCSTEYKGATPIPGFQLRYIYFIDKSKRKDLTVPEIPFSKIDELGAGMYKGEKITFAERHSKVTPEE